jgi:2-polyprenyl-6-methoxyphenol hydroxylase-like FAD-dependent oxidoreductase
MRPAAHFHVLVAGAGPAGSACATLLARAGMSVLLCDKEQFPRDKICGDCINPGSWRYFEALGVANSLRQVDLHRIEFVRLQNLTGKQVIVPVHATAGKPFFSIKRSTLDTVLVQNAEREGVTLVQQTQVLDATFSGSWNVLVRSKNGIQSYSCDYLVGADGRNSTVASKIGAWGKPDSSATSLRRVGLQWHADVQPHVGSEVQLYTMKDGYFGIVNVDDQNSNVAMVTSPAIAREALSDFPQFIERTFYSNPAVRRYVNHVEPCRGVATAYPINPIRRHWNHTNAFLAGDARQTVEPFTGEGVSFALEDGMRTARQIVARFDGKVPDGRQPRGNFWVNRVFSPALKNQKLVESLLAVGSELPWFPHILARTVFHASL